MRFLADIRLYIERRLKTDESEEEAVQVAIGKIVTDLAQSGYRLTVERILNEDDPPDSVNPPDSVETAAPNKKRPDPNEDFNNDGGEERDFSDDGGEAEEFEEEDEDEEEEDEDEEDDTGDEDEEFEDEDDDDTGDDDKEFEDGDGHMQSPC